MWFPSSVIRGALLYFTCGSCSGRMSFWCVFYRVWFCYVLDLLPTFLFVFMLFEAAVRYNAEESTTELNLRRMGPFRLCRTLSSLYYSLFQIKTEECTHILLKHHFINTISLLHVSALKGLSSGITTDQFQQQGQRKELPDVQYQFGKFILLTLLLKCICHTLWGWPFEGWNI